jgi:hypothetical protein
MIKRRLWVVFVKQFAEGFLAFIDELQMQF